MFLILFGDQRLVPQDYLLLKSTMTSSGMQPINMISTVMQGKRKGKLSFHNKLIHLMNLTMILEKTPHLIKTMMILPHTQSFDLLSTLLNIKQPTKIIIPNQLGEEFPEAWKNLIIEYNKKVKVADPKSYGGNPEPKTSLVNTIQSPSKSISVRMTILLKTLILKILPRLWWMSA